MTNKKLPSRREITPASSEAASGKRATYTDEFKRTSVARLHSREQSATDLDMELGIRRNMLYKSNGLRRSKSKRPTKSCAHLADRLLAIEQIYAAAHKLGVSLQSVMDGGRATPAVARRQGQRYRDPSEPSNTWAGIGPQPVWFKKPWPRACPLTVCGSERAWLQALRQSGLFGELGLLQQFSFVAHKLFL